MFPFTSLILLVVLIIEEIHPKGIFLHGNLLSCIDMSSLNSSVNVLLVDMFQRLVLRRVLKIPLTVDQMIINSLADKFDRKTKSLSV